MTRPRKELISSQGIEPNFIGHLKRKEKPFLKVCCVFILDYMLFKVSVSADCSRSKV
jgi:hypothetical protein